MVSRFAPNRLIQRARLSAAVLSVSAVPQVYAQGLPTLEDPSRGTGSGSASSPSTRTAVAITCTPPSKYPRGCM